MSKIILKAKDLDGYLSASDNDYLARMDSLYRQAMVSFNILSTSRSDFELKREEDSLIDLYNTMGALMQELCAAEPRIQVYSFTTPQENHGEASRLIAKLRDANTGRQEFVYYTQRAFELLFNLTFAGAGRPKKNYLIVKTPVGIPVQNYAVHKIPDIDDQLADTVMCVMLRGALLPSMIISKEIQEYSSSGYLTPFALFKIKRDDSKSEDTMEYILDLDRSYFKLEDLDGKNLVFADPMNATGGSLVTIVKYLLEQGVKPKSVKFLNVISALKGSLRIVRAIENVTVYTLWMDPVLNERAYIMAGLGDAGDRINGRDEENDPRDMLRLVADYGTNITGLYRSQLRVIEQTVLQH
ncbi:MAG TPA: uracil phosphoribosyltransferase [Spirochaetaceae bacterium]|nr:uracil phosphoribosyltransferase [Spirochaetaceae bacterium]